MANFLEKKNDSKKKQNNPIRPKNFKIISIQKAIQPPSPQKILERLAPDIQGVYHPHLAQTPVEGRNQRKLPNLLFHINLTAKDCVRRKKIESLLTNERKSKHS